MLDKYIHIVTSLRTYNGDRHQQHCKTCNEYLNKKYNFIDEKILFIDLITNSFNNYGTVVNYSNQIQRNTYGSY